MPGETGSASDNGEDGSDHGYIPTQTDSLCLTCGKTSSQELQQYGDTYAGGNSSNFIGDIHGGVHIVYCSSHCARHSEQDTADVERRSVADSRGTSSQSPTRGLSRTHTLNTLPSIDGRLIPQPVSEGTPTVASHGREIPALIGNNNGGPGSAAESVPPSLIGMKTVQRSRTEQVNWIDVCSVAADRVSLNIQDAHVSEEKLRSNDKYPFVPLACEWTSCTVLIQAHQNTGFRRLIVEKDDACEVWLPDTNIQVTFDDLEVRMQFSNCNKLQPPGHYRTQDGIPTSVTTYHPEEPNVTLEIRFDTRTVADTFRKHVLRTDDLDEGSDAVFKQQSPQIEVLHGLRNTTKDTDKSCILVWKHNIDTETNSALESHDIVAIADRFDLNIMAEKEKVDVSIRYVERLTYYPAFDQPHPPQNVKRTLDGAPTKSILKSGHELRLSTSSTEVKQLVNHVLSKTLSWRLEAVFCQVGVKTSKRLKLGSNNYTAQVTLWTDSTDHTIRISIRTSGTTDDSRKSVSKKVEWFSITLAEGEDQPAAESKQNNLTIKKVDYEAGDCLSTSDLRPMDADAKPDEKSNGNNTTSINLELSFSSEEEVGQFREIVTDRYLHITDS